MTELQEIYLTGPPFIWANSGAWASRMRREKITSTLLGQDDGYVRCPRTIRIGLTFEDTHPVACVESILAAAGFRSYEDLRQVIALPETRLICRLQQGPVKRLTVAGSSHLEVLEQALWLGLCTPQLFDPERPVMWTETSLMRALELFDPTGYYA